MTRMGMGVYAEEDLVLIGGITPCPACGAYGIPCNGPCAPAHKTGDRQQWVCSNHACPVIVFAAEMRPP
jgi:hypothetical protein